jgi:hypothetical protein
MKMMQLMERGDLRDGLHQVPARGFPGFLLLVSLRGFFNVPRLEQCRVVCASLLLLEILIDALVLECGSTLSLGVPADCRIQSS